MCISGRSCSSPTSFTKGVGVSETEVQGAPGEEEVVERPAERPEPVTSEDLSELLEQRNARIKELEDRQKAAEERVARAERERDEAHGTVHNEQSARIRAQETAIETALAGVAAEADQVEERITQLQTEGKFADATKLMRRFSELEVRKAQLEGQKGQVAQWKARAADVPQGPDMSQFTSVEREWLRGRPEYFSDESFARKVRRAASRAEDEGLDRNSRAYIDFIEEEIGGGERERPAAVEEERPARQAPVLPVARRAP